ncbi:uncharacterized protein LOC129287196 isoform X2 [Prosopis cineraria]|uniref:uncharacterized protein LOC129287196 isoform X2 n=1 Tax=Prosopis cineraria TaxID=364024 RepID=UPI00241093FA|nr:uncharacterized protein LOC129287196 isoform X2 [Prosopis cineraria]
MSMDLHRSSSTKKGFEDLSWDELMGCTVDDSLDGEEDIPRVNFSGEVTSLNRKISWAPGPKDSSLGSSNFFDVVVVQQKQVQSFDLNEEATKDSEEVSSGNGNGISDRGREGKKRKIVHPFDLNKFPFPNENYVHLTEEEKARYDTASGAFNKDIDGIGVTKPDSYASKILIK